MPTCRPLGLALALTMLAASPALADDSWMNGTNPFPDAELRSGPLAWTFMVDTYYGWAFNRPADHTVFPTTTAPRHHEVALNLAMIGAEVTGIDDVVGKLVLQHGNYVDSVVAPDASLGRGSYSSLASLRHVQQAYAGYRLGGVTYKMGIFPAHIGLDSYNPQENWSYTHILTSDFTPYYLSGAVAEFSPAERLTAQLWLVNGWQTLTKISEGFGYGYSLNYRPDETISLSQNLLAGNFERDTSRTRIYANHVLQWKYATRPAPWVKHLALAAVADVGYNSAGSQQPAAFLGGAGLQHRTVFDDRWAASLRGSVYHDPQQLVALAAPAGATLPPGALTIGELTATLDFRPAPWVLNRLELRHDMSSAPYIAGPGGITAPEGQAGFTPDFVTAGTRVVLNTTVRF